MTAVSTPESATSALPPAERRISRRIAAISESATLAVDAKAKALKAAGKPVIGFGAGEPDFPTPDYIVEAAVAACRQPAMHRYTPAGGLPALKEAIVAKTARDSGLQATAGQRAGHQRRQAGGLRGLRHDARPGRRGARCPRRTGRPTRRRSGWPAACRCRWSPTSRAATSSRRPSSRRRAPRARRCCCSARRPTRPARSTRPSRSRRSAAGRWTRASGCSPTRSTSTSPTAASRRRRCRWSCPSSPTAASSSTASPRPTR